MVFFVPLTVLFVLFLVLALPFLFVLLQLGVISFAFDKLGIPSSLALGFYVTSLLLSSINIPVYRRPVLAPLDIDSGPFVRFLFTAPQVVREQVIAINVGGAAVPAVLALFLLLRAPLVPALLATAVVTLVAYAFSRPVPGVGIVIPFWIAPFTSVLAAMIFAPTAPAPVAYISGVFGTLIGADILHIRHFMKSSPGILSIGGAGVYDGIFLAGLVAAFLS